MSPFNRPRMNNQRNDGKVKKFTHQPFSTDHFGVQISINENGRVKFSKASPDPDNLGMELVDEVEVSTSAIYKAVSIIELTRKVSFVDPSELKKGLRHNAQSSSDSSNEEETETV